jgi:ribonuclease HI
LLRRARGALLGLAIGDALGGPVEFLSPTEIRARYGRPVDEYVGAGRLSLVPRHGRVIAGTLQADAAQQMSSCCAFRWAQPSSASEAQPASAKAAVKAAAAARNVSGMVLTTELWTDGACSGNPGPGGWAYILVARRDDGTIAKALEGYGGEKATTNNRMELTAALEGLRALARPTAVTIHPDSAYLEESFTKGRLRNWQRNGWKTASKKPVKNQEMWVALLEATRPHTVTWKRVKGHSTVALNNRCDELAVHQRDIQAGLIAVGTPPPEAHAVVSGRGHGT